MDGQTNVRTDESLCQTHIDTFPTPKEFLTLQRLRLLLRNQFFRSDSDIYQRADDLKLTLTANDIVTFVKESGRKHIKAKFREHVKGGLMKHQSDLRILTRGEIKFKRYQGWSPPNSKLFSEILA